MAVDYLTVDGRRAGLPDDGEIASVEWLFEIGGCHSPDGLPVFHIDNYQGLECRVGSERWRIVDPSRRRTLSAGEGRQVVENAIVFEIPSPKTRGRFRVLCNLLDIVTDEG